MARTRRTESDGGHHACPGGSGELTSSEVPTWVIVACALAMGLGTMVGGWRIIRTLGIKMVKLEPVHRICR
ncbi:MAG: inorganic phosphate transporter [Nitrospira sp.]